MSAQAPEQSVVESIARICHHVNREYCSMEGDYSQPSWDDAPQWQRDSAIAGVKLHLNDPSAGPRASHESWMAQKVADGWTYGPEKDPQRKQHPCLMPFDDLDIFQRGKDYIFRGIVHAIATELVRQNEITEGAQS